MAGLSAPGEAVSPGALSVLRCLRLQYLSVWTGSSIRTNYGKSVPSPGGLALPNKAHRVNALAVAWLSTPGEAAAPGALAVRRSLETRSVLSPGALLSPGVLAFPNTAHRVNAPAMARLSTPGEAAAPGALLSPDVLIPGKAKNTG
ncbi:hypothetical protein IX84_07065 [Phaeodactylibacter xiamenensis]|uniref:Uncharacterized protein n=1 Tax=Phaeodactylibacter xiamenensis TaxID=1524460 RepID=A0A098S9W7_9BACT|nr:hypothetical protein IX84_07065 [Phaeodactylibacter xiamenensis]